MKLVNQYIHIHNIYLLNPSRFIPPPPIAAANHRPATTLRGLGFGRIFIWGELFDTIEKRGNRKMWKQNKLHSNYSSPSKRGGGGDVSTSEVVAPLPPETIEAIRLFRYVEVSERESLFLRKVQHCCVQFDFLDEWTNIKEKAMKREMLFDLIDFVDSGSDILSVINQEEMIKMVSLNIFRSLPPGLHENTVTGGDDLEEHKVKAYFEPLWPHLELVYQLLVQYLLSSSTDVKVAKRFIDHAFLLRLLDLFDSEDLRERSYLRNILHKIYGKFIGHRSFIRKGISNIFYRFIYETESHNGIVELLDIIGSMINGFALPLKDEHKLFLTRALIPLHKPKSVGMYHPSLSYCVVQFVEKDCKLADTVIRGLLKYWPVTNCQKELLFLEELEEVLVATQTLEFQRCMVPLFKQISCCVNSFHHQIAERALCLWKNERIWSLTIQDRNVILPIIFEALERNMQPHWNSVVHKLTVQVRKKFLQKDGELFEECQRQYAEKQDKAREEAERRESTWQKLAVLAAQQAA